MRTCPPPAGARVPRREAPGTASRAGSVSGPPHSANVPKTGLGRSDRGQYGIGLVGGQHPRPRVDGRLPPDAPAAAAAGLMASTRLPDGEDALGDVLGHVHAELVLEPRQQLHALHRIEAEVEFEVRIRTDGDSVRRGAADDRQDAGHVRVGGPRLVRVAPLGRLALRLRRRPASPCTAARSRAASACASSSAAGPPSRRRS